MKRDLTDEQLRQEVTVVLPLSVVLRIGEEQTLAQEQPARFIPAGRALPKIGAEYEGGVYAGPSLDNDQLVALVVLPGDEKMPWKDTLQHAEKLGGVLPSRIDQIVLFKNLKSAFKQDYYWSCEQYEGYADSAWAQFFFNGYQYNYLKDNDFRVRVVRRIVIR